MRILPRTYAVFWKHSRASRQAFHADIAADTARDAARIFGAHYPADIIVSIRDRSGKFAAFN